MNFITPAYAQAAGAAGSTDFVMQLVPFAVILVIMYFMIMRPQQKRAKAHQEMITNVRRGDTVVTAGGMIAKVSRTLDDAEIEVEIAQGVKVRLLRARAAGASRSPAGHCGQRPRARGEACGREEGAGEGEGARGRRGGRRSGGCGWKKQRREERREKGEGGGRRGRCRELLGSQQRGLALRGQRQVQELALVQAVLARALPAAGHGAQRAPHARARQGCCCCCCCCCCRRGPRKVREASHGRPHVQPDGSSVCSSLGGGSGSGSGGSGGD